MKKLTFIFILAYWNISAQTIFDVQVDKIYIEDDNITFIKEGELNTYECQISTLKIRDYQYKLTLKCEEDNGKSWIADTLRIEFANIKVFDEPKQLIKWLEKRLIANASNTTDSIDNSYIQYFDDNFFVQTHFKNYSKESLKWKFKHADFLDYVCLRINGEYLIIALVDKDDGEIVGYIVPKKNRTIAILHGKQYTEQWKSNITLNLEKDLQPKSFFRIKKEGNDYQLYDKLFQEPIIEGSFSEIRLGDQLILCENENRITIYNKSAQKILESNVVAACDTFQSIQYLKDNRIYWIDYNGVIHDTFPKPRRFLCDNSSTVYRSIITMDKGFKVVRRMVYSYRERGEKIDSMEIVMDHSVNTLKYLNNSNEQSFHEYSHVDAVFYFPYSYYIMEEGGKQHLVAIIKDRWKREAKLNEEKKFLEEFIALIEKDKGPKRKKGLAPLELQRDSIDVLINQLEEFRIEIKFTGEFETYGYFHPIKFKEGNLYGYYPQHIKAKYKKLDQFNFFFAKFEMENGRKGWLDIYGKEYFIE